MWRFRLSYEQTMVLRGCRDSSGEFAYSPAITVSSGIVGAAYPGDGRYLGEILHARFALLARV